MKVTPEIIRHEFIGLIVEVVRSSNPSYVGIKGRVIDETRNTFVIEADGEEKRIIKNISIFHFKYADGTVIEIDGKMLIGRPEDRIKKVIRRRW
ncbi:ribonuclease P protein subunit [Candidatus Bathyarchaeota archaeon]|nr:MAG: ribonuclease P protein subunit [Candidatus Bathyarchaeota archaeon]